MVPTWHVETTAIWATTEGPTTSLVALTAMRQSKENNFVVVER